ncbi:FecR family protein [Alistipes megaguti]|uniref:FecR family protein n=1 Tax=Alistipes megaguti TaxID=2364787 RepID=UPI002356C9AA|nr:FecR family protein [Alistipes megaguti]
MEKETLYRFFRGEASPEEERRLMEWLDADAENRRTFDRERALFTALQLFAPRPKARARVSALRPGRRSGVLRRLAAPALRIAAVVALAVGISWGVISHREHNWEQLTNRIVVPAGQRINLTLQDGTSVWLNSGSELEYPALFAGATRQVKLRGTALFDVTGNAERPFIVETYACRVEVLGTRFNVRADEQNDEFSTALFRGSVRVTSRDSLHQQVTLRPNERVLLEEGRLRVEPADDPNEYLWTEGQISIGGCSFEEILARFESCYGVRFDVRLKQLPKVGSIGKIRISDGIEHALSILQRNGDFRYTYDTQTNVITIY